VPSRRRFRRDRVRGALTRHPLFERALSQRPPDFSNHGVRGTEPVVEQHHRDVAGRGPAQGFGIAHVPDDQVGPQSVHDARGFGECPGRCDGKAQFREDRTDPPASKRAVAEIIALRSSQEWAEAFEGKDVCCCVVKSVEEAMHDPHFASRGLFSRSVAVDEDALPAVSVPI